jgi:hypothetical protein
VSFSLRAVKAAEFAYESAAFEQELAGVFRAVESEVYRALRKAAKEGLTQDQTIALVAAVLDKEVGHADAKAPIWGK